MTDDEPELIGYSDRFSVAAGEDISFHVSGDVTTATARLVRLRHGDAISPIGYLEDECDSSLDGDWDIAKQDVFAGSFGLVTLPAAIGEVKSGSFHARVFMHPTIVTPNSREGVVAALDADEQPVWELIRDGERITFSIRTDDDTWMSVTSPTPVVAHRWYAVACGVDPAAGMARLAVSPVRHAGRTPLEQSEIRIGGTRSRQGSHVLLGARRLIRVNSLEPRAAETFNGWLEDFALSSAPPNEQELAAAVDPRTNRGAPAGSVIDLDLGRDPDSWNIVDRCGNTVGQLFNGPERAVTGRGWNGGSTSPVAAPLDYGAVAFHADDVIDANWAATRTWTVPPDLPSGFYAVRLTSGHVVDRIPFVIRASREGARNDVAFWVPSYTYAAYTNEDPEDYEFGEYRSKRGPLDELFRRHPEWGGSSYDRHPDGTGRVLSSLRRPVPNLRPTYRYPLVNGPRGLAADLYVVHWLEHLDVGVDYITDEDVHAEGAALLRRYGTVISGTHPEYVTANHLDAMESYLDDDGRFMYLGGNGFYWVTTPEPTGDRVCIEVRRAVAGTRAWEPSPGNGHHQFSGEAGGIWSHRGRPPHALLGVGFVSQGWDGRNPPYLKTSDARRPEAAWAFAGIPDDEPIGAHGLVMNGAAGDEIDSADSQLGSPESTIVLASARLDSDAYLLATERVLLPTRDVAGSSNEAIRADAVLLPRADTGAVFSCGSMSWAACLSHNGYDNALERLTRNVLSVFRSHDTPWTAESRATDHAACELSEYAAAVT